MTFGSPRSAFSIAAAFAALLSAPALAGDPSGYAASDKGDLCASVEAGVDCMIVRLDHLHQVKLEQPVKTLLIGNPAIADVNLIGAEHAVVTARAVGSTNIFFLDEGNEPIAQYRVFVRESDARRVMLHRGPGNVAQFQCSPRCERALSQSDSGEAFKALSAKVKSAAALANKAAAEGEAGE